MFNVKLHKTFIWLWKTLQTYTFLRTVSYLYKLYVKLHKLFVNYLYFE